MNKNYYEREKKTATKLQKAVFLMYSELRKEKIEQDPVAAKYLTTNYYAEIITQNPLIDLQQSTIVRIINSFIRGYRK